MAWRRREQPGHPPLMLLLGAVCCLGFGGTSHSLAFSLGSLDFSLGFTRLLPSVLSRPGSLQAGCKSELEELRRWHASLAGPAHEAGHAGDAPPAHSSRGRQLLAMKGLAEGDTGVEAEWLVDKKVERHLADLSAPELQNIVVQQKEDMQKVKDDIEELKAALRKLTNTKSMLDFNITTNRPDFTEALLTPQLMEQARSLISKCSGTGMVLSKQAPTWKGYSCSADDDTISKYLAYPDRGACPDDWPATQNMIFVDNCHALPKRRCRNPTSASWREPLPFPQSLFDQNALIDTNVRWVQHGCKSFDCLNSRLIGDCRNCFDMGLEKRRWRRAYRGSIPMKDVIALKNGSLRIGLDAGGGSGSFAAHMALHGVTVMTTAMNIETIKGRTLGLPYMETIALRGLIPLHVPHKSRLPFFDNTLDIIHCVNSVKYLPMLEFEELLFEWDRVLRVGGVMWFEMFYAPLDEMPIYVALIQQLGYKKLHWNMLPKPDYGERKGIHVYLNCVIEKPVHKEPSGWFG